MIGNLGSNGAGGGGPSPFGVPGSETTGYASKTFDDVHLTKFKFITLEISGYGD